MFVAIGSDSRGDSEGQTFGPFTTKNKAVRFAHRLDLATGVIDEETERACQDGTRFGSDVLDSLVDMGWRFEEVTHVEEDDEELLDWTDPDAPHIVVEDDGTVHGPYDMREAALVWAVNKIAEPLDEAWTPGILLASNGAEMLAYSRSYVARAQALLGREDRLDPADFSSRALDLIHDVDWIVTTPAVYLAENIQYPNE